MEGLSLEGSEGEVEKRISKLEALSKELLYFPGHGGLDKTEVDLGTGHQHYPVLQSFLKDEVNNQVPLSPHLVTVQELMLKKRKMSSKRSQSNSLPYSPLSML